MIPVTGFSRGGQALPVKPKSILPARGGMASPVTPKPATPKTRTDPATGLPTMMSNQEIRAEANQQTWASIKSMLGQLPSIGATDAPFNAQRAAVAPLVDAHRNWLMNAANYHMGMVNGVAQITQGAASAADAVQAGGAGSAGLGANFTSNVTPAGVATPALAYGGSVHDYLNSLEPFATAQGIGAIGRVNTAQDAADADRTEEARKITSQFGDLLNKNTSSIGTAAFNTYKGEIAALAAAAAQGTKDATLKERTANDKARTEILARNATTAEKRANNAVQTAKDKGQIAATDKRSKSLSTFLAAADKIYKTPGGVKSSSTKGSQAYSITLTFQPPLDQFGVASAKATKKTLYGNTPKEVLAAADAFRRANAAKPNAAGNKGHWDTPAYEKAPGPSSTTSGITDKPSENTRRARAWSYLLAQNETLGGNKYSTDELKRIWLTMHPKTAK